MSDKPHYKLQTDGILLKQCIIPGRPFGSEWMIRDPAWREQVAKARATVRWEPVYLWNVNKRTHQQ